ncbi:GAF domain-containing protein [uncultured Methylobacterium sp.]|jgi:PAS domain S-box-containing protein|uniref:GAF domain-containing protein n=1 Tax=uncultured Methylobacterium sp. TaxID=157278 RepID=UPI0026280149|nr:GAF domain-containing protein [uncultured Methylobacterium sp.]
MQIDPRTLVLDPARLATLDAYSILDTPAEQGFDDIVRLATRLCAVPVALVSFVAADRQWFKARLGFPPCETDLDSSVCRFVLAEPDLLVIPDLTADPRTAFNPLVTGEPHIRFYGGAPLRTLEGHILGSLCVIDTVPRPQGLTPEQADDLRALARQVTELLAMRRAVERRDVVLDHQRGALRQAHHLDVLARASQALLTASDPATVLDPILSASAGLLGFDRSYTYDLWPGSQDLRLTHSFNATEEVQSYLRRLAPGAPLCGIVAQRRQPLVLTALQDSEEPAYQNARGIGLNAYAGFPLISRGSLRGVISFASTRQAAFDDEILAFFATLARLMSAVYERLDGEKALRDSDTRSRLAQEAGGIGTFELTIDTGLMSISPVFARLFGVPSTGVYAAETFEAMILPEDRPSASGEATRQDGSAVEDVEYRIRRAADGALRWIARRATFTQDASGQVTRMFGTVQDVTERREAEARLAESEKRFRTILDTVEAAFAIVEVKFDDDRPVDYRFLEANPAFERQAGVDLRGKWVTEFAPDLERFWFETYGRVAKTREPATFESYAEAFKRWFDVRAVPIGDPADRQIAILFNDVTERRAAQDALAASEAHWRGLFERLSEGFLIGKVLRNGTGAIRDWCYVDVNAAWGDLVGIDPATVIGRTIREVFPGIEDAWVDEFATVVDTGEPITFTRQVGSLARWYEGRAFPLGGEQFGVIFLEITDRVQSEARRTALLTLGDRLRDLTDTEALTQVTCEILGTTLDAMLVGYGDVDPQQETITVARDWTAGGAETLTGTLHFRDYGSYIEDLKRDRTVVVHDCRTDPRTSDHAAALEARSARAFVNTPIFERGAFVAMLFVCTGQARDWTRPELTFIREVASRLRSAIARARAEERQDLLNHELSHRLKNTLAVVQSIASQTLRSVPERDPVVAFEQRIITLARAHDILLQDAWSATSLRAVAIKVLEPHAALDRFDLDGPDIGLSPPAVLSLSLLLHELATNAAKYGALSVEGGQVHLTWSVLAGSEARLEVRWRETGGPPAIEPKRHGFGSRLIRTGLVGNRDATLDYTSAGLAASFRAPLREVTVS